MHEATFFTRAASLELSDIAALAGIALPDGMDPAFSVDDVSALERAAPHSLTYADKPKLGSQVAQLPAGSVIVCTANVASAVPSGVLGLVCAAPAAAFHTATARLYPDSLAPAFCDGVVAHPDGTYRHPSAMIEQGVTLAPGVIIGAGVEIGSGTRIGAHSVIADGCKIGRDCRIDINVSIQCAYVGDRVILHAGVRIGQDGFGYVPGPKGLVKIPQLGRVIIQNAVEIGANSTIDRGALRDTVIGEGTKIDNLVQIAHNVHVGRHCAIAAQVGIAGSSSIGDGTMLGGAAGIADHVSIGRGVMLGARSGVMHDIPDGERWSGIPAKPTRQNFKEIAALAALAKNRGTKDE